MARVLLVVFLVICNCSYAQQLWGSLQPGPYAVGYKSFREADKKLVSVWYPGEPSSTAKAVLFRNYLENPDEFHKTMERPFIANAKIPDDAYKQVLNLPTAARWNLPEIARKFPTVLMTSEPESLSVTAEFLASNGFVVAVVTGPYPKQQPADSLLYAEPTKHLSWLLNYVSKFKNVDQDKLMALGFGGGIQSAFYLTMKSDKIKALVNLEGGVFSPRSKTEKSPDYNPSMMRTPMLHIVTVEQQREDDIKQQEALTNTTISKAFIQHQGLHHHDFSIYGRVLNKGLKMRGALGDIADQTYSSVHKMILEFLQLTLEGKNFPIDRRYMPFINLSLTTDEPGLVLHQPAMDKVIVEEGKKFWSGNDTTLVFDAYYPPGFDKKQQLPVVVFVNGVGSLDLYRWKIYKDWGRLVAANGMIAINYQTRRNRAPADTEQLLDYLRSNSNALSIDKDKIGLWSCSANVSTGLPLAMKESRSDIKAAVVYYGMPQLTELPNPLRQDLELLVVRAGLDFYYLNLGIDGFMRRAITEDLHVEYISYPEGQHAFDAVDDTPRSREIILQTIEFLKRTLSKDHTVPAKTVITNSRLWNMIMVEKKVDEALNERKAAADIYTSMPNHSPWFNHVIDERNLNQMGYELLGAGRADDALKVLTANQEQFPQSANVYDALGDAYEKKGDKQNAVLYAKKALEKLAAQTDLRPEFRDGIKRSAEDKINRLQ